MIQQKIGKLSGHLEDRNVTGEAHPIADRARTENTNHPEHKYNCDEHVVRVGDVLLCRNN